MSTGPARNIEAIVVGGSAGALDALAAILPALPPAYPIPIAIVLHIPRGQPSHLADVLGAKCALAVREPDDKESLAPATVYLAPSNYHLLIERTRHFSLSVDSPIHFSRPAIDVLFESAAEAYGSSVLGLLLSGANEDGAQGLARIGSLGGTTVIQSPETSLARTMPEAALQLLEVDHILPPAEIGPFLAQLSQRTTMNTVGK